MQTSKYFIALFLLSIFVCGVTYSQSESEKTSIEITGQIIANEVLIQDTLRQIEIFEGVYQRGMFSKIHMEILGTEEDTKSTIQRWTVTDNNNSQKSYIVKYTPTPEQGGTDIFIREDKEFPEGAQKLIIDMR